MIVEKQYLEINGTPVLILKVEGIIKLGESAAFFLFAFQSKTLWDGNVVVDIEKIDYIDSTCVGEFIGICVALARNGRNLVLPQPLPDFPSANDRIDRSIRAARAADDIRLFRTEEEAIAAVITPRKTIDPLPVEGRKPNAKK